MHRVKEGGGLVPDVCGEGERGDLIGKDEKSW